MTSTDQTCYTTLTGLHVYHRDAHDYALIRTANEREIIGEIEQLGGTMSDARQYVVLVYAKGIPGYSDLLVGRRFETLTDAIAATCEAL